MPDQNSQSLASKRKHFRWLQLADKQSIISDASLGLSQQKIAEKYAISRATVARVMKDFKQACPKAELAQDLSQYRERLKGKAITAVENGLDCPDDPYKQGNLGVAVLKGIGVFNDVAPNNSMMNFIIGNAPPSILEMMKAEGVFDPVEDEQVIDVTPECVQERPRVDGGFTL